MSKVTISGNASGTGVFTIAAPNSNTDRVLTLPDEAGTVLTSASSIPVANLDSAVGVTEADQWRLTTNLTSSTTYITANLERVDTDGFGQLGTGMTESSGVFTFPSTGIYWILANASFYSSSVNVRFANIYIETTTDGSGYSIGASGGTSWSVISSAATGGSASANFVFDVTNTSTHKVKFRVENSTSHTIEGATDASLTYFTFVRLGDT